MGYAARVIPHRVRSAAVVAAVVAVVAVTLGALPMASASAASKSSVTVLAPGVTLTRSNFTMRSGSAKLSERSYVVRTTLSAHTSLVAATPNNVIGAPRTTVLSMARQQHAIAGVNGDVFYLSDPTSVPRGGVTWNGHILKSTLAHKTASLYITSQGVASIGDPTFVGAFSTSNGHNHGIATMNSLENARNGGTTLVDSSVLSRSMPRCSTSLLRPRTDGRYTVVGTWTDVTRFTRIASGYRELVSCSATNARYFPSSLTRGLTVSIRAGYSVPSLTTVLSGGQVLVRSGKAYHDPQGVTTYGKQRKPESFVCVLKGGRTVLFGAVEGDRRGVAGMTYTELGNYTRSLGCWSSMTLDGSKSSTLVAASPGHALAVQNRVTNTGGPRKVVDGLFVVRH